MVPGWQRIQRKHYHLQAKDKNGIIMHCDATRHIRLLTWTHRHRTINKAVKLRGHGSFYVVYHGSLPLTFPQSLPRSAYAS